MKKLTSLTLFLALLLSVLSPALALDQQDGAQLLFERGYLTEEEAARDGAEPLTRGEFCALLNRVFDLSTTLFDPFSDLLGRYRFDMMAAYAEGYLKGYGDGTVRPDQALNRLEGAVMLSRLLSLPEPKDAPAFSDELQIPSWGLSACRALCSEGFFSADADGAFGPFEPLTVRDAYSALAQVVALNLGMHYTHELKHFTAFDGYELEGRLTLPLGQDKVEKLVIFASGSGADTYNMERQDGDTHFIYLDYFAKEFAARGHAMFSYSTRGITAWDVESPFYQMDEQAYATYTPQNVVKDLNTMVDALREDPRLKGTQIYLLGWSEGAAIAPLAVTQGLAVDGLLLAGYPNANMREIIEWQMGGERMMYLYDYLLDSEEGKIDKARYESKGQDYITQVFGMSFEDTDLDQDGFITSADFKLMHKELYDGLMEAVEAHDQSWIFSNYMALTPEWFEAHFALGSTEDILAQVDIPIHIFHGDLDLNCPVQGVYDAYARFEEEGKDNLEIHVYKEHDHDLNFSSWLLTRTLSEGILGIMEAVDAF